MDASHESRFEETDVLALFPSLVWKLQVRAALRDTIAAALTVLLDELLRGTTPLGAGQGWQSRQDLHMRPELCTLLDCIHLASARILRFLQVDAAQLQVTGCWLNLLMPGAAHHMHSHPNNFLSGVYYLQTPERADCINFHDPRAQCSIIRPPVTALTSANADQIVVRVRAGTLLCFPAWLPHSVDASRGDSARISVSFNLMFGAFAEHLAQPLWSAGATHA